MNAPLDRSPLLASSSPSPPLSEQTREWIAAMLEGNGDTAFIFFTPEGVVSDWRGAAQRMFGYIWQEALGMPFSALFTDEDRARGLDEQELALAKTTGRSEDDRWHVRKNGGRFWANGVLTAVRERSVEGQGEPGRQQGHESHGEGKLVALCKIIRDRTDIRTQILALENQLAARNEDLARRDRVAMFVAHEMLNPMMPITSAVALLQKSDDADVRARACDIIGRQVGVLRGLVHDLRNATRAGSVGALISPERISVNEALQQAADALRGGAEAGGLLLSLVLPAPTIWINADPLRLQQMLSNLIGNAMKFNASGGHITVSVTVEGDMAVIRVEDDGRGISPEMIPRLFELFTREERGPPVDGMGVGLAVVQDLARRHGGGVEARSPGIGLGSMFALRLPLHGSGRPRPQEEPLS